MNAGYTTRDVAKLLKMPEHRVRELVRAGVVGEGREPKRLRFDFRDVVVLRMAHRLVQNGLPPKRVKKALVLLKEQIHRGPLTGISVFAEGQRLFASDGERLWEPESGQQYLQFEKPEVDDAPVPAPVAPSASVPPDFMRDDAPRSSSADSWFDIGLGLEESEPHRAYEAYLKALEEDPEHVETHINIGRLCSAAGELTRAAAYFRQALRLDPAQPVAQFNLAVTLHDMGDFTAAREAYKAALAYDPDFADAHYNLATLLEQSGDADEAHEHMQAYEAVLRKADGKGDR